MNWLDLLIVGILAWTTFRAFSSGLISELVSLLALVAGIALAGAYYDDLAANLEFIITDPTSRRLAAFAGIFIGTTIAGYVIATVLKTAAALLFLGAFDHLGGAVFGLIKGFLLVQIVLVAISVFPAQATIARATADSKLAPVFLKFTPIIKAALPAEFHDPLGQLLRWQTGGALQGMPGLPPGMPGIPGIPVPTARP